MNRRVQTFDRDAFMAELRRRHPEAMFHDGPASQQDEYSKSVLVSQLMNRWFGPIISTRITPITPITRVAH